MNTDGDKYAYRRQVEYFQVLLDRPFHKVDIKQATQTLGAQAAPQTFVWLVTFCSTVCQEELRKSPKNVSDTRTYPRRCPTVQKTSNNRQRQEHPFWKFNFLFSEIPRAGGDRHKNRVTALSIGFCGIHFEVVSFLLVYYN